MQRWKIELNELKSVNFTGTLKRAGPYGKIYIEGKAVPQSNSDKYFGMHLDLRLPWRQNIMQKVAQFRLKARQLY